MPRPLLLDPASAVRRVQTRTGSALRGLVKLHPADWAAASALPAFSHVNAVPCTNEPGLPYAAMRIATPGAPGRGPRMDASAWVLLRCESVEEAGRCDTFDEATLGTLLGRPATRAALFDLMHERYAQLRPEWAQWPGGRIAVCRFSRLAD